MTRLLYVISDSTAAPARAVTALAAAAASAAAGHSVALWLSGEGVRLAVDGLAEVLETRGLPSATASLGLLDEKGAAAWTSAPCYARLGFEASGLRPNARLVDMAHLATLVEEGWTPVSL